MSVNLRDELQHPTTLWGKRYLSLVLFDVPPFSVALGFGVRGLI